MVTARPTLQPVTTPTTSVPSAIPSTTGLIAIFDITKVVTSSLTDQEISSIATEVTENFDVPPQEVSTTGTQTIDLIFILVLSLIFCFWYYDD